LVYNLVDKIKIALEKIPEFTEHAPKLTEDEKFKTILDTSGSVGGLMKLYILVLEKIYEHLEISKVNRSK